MDRLTGTERPRRRAIGWWVAACFVAGAVIGSASLWPEFFKRLHWASSGGGGESADWGEPLFHMVILSIPGSLVGTGIGLATAFTIRQLIKAKEERS